MPNDPFAKREAGETADGLPIVSVNSRSEGAIPDEIPAVIAEPESEHRRRTARSWHLRWHDNDFRAGVLGLVLPAYYLAALIVFPLAALVFLGLTATHGSHRLECEMLAATVDAFSISLASAAAIWLAWGRWRAGWHWLGAFLLCIVAGWMALATFDDEPAVTVVTLAQVAVVGTPLALLRLLRGIAGRPRLAKGGPLLIRPADFQFRLIDYFILSVPFAFAALLLRPYLLDFRWVSDKLLLLGPLRVVCGAGVVAAALLAAFDAKRKQWVNFIVQTFAWIVFAMAYALAVAGIANYFNIELLPVPTVPFPPQITFWDLFEHYWWLAIWGNAVAGIITWGAMRIVRWGGYEFVWWKANESGKW